METKSQEEPDENQKPQSDHLKEGKTTKKEKFNLYDSFLSIHFDSRDKNSAENEIRMALDKLKNEYARYFREPQDAKRIEFWFRMYSYSYPPYPQDKDEFNKEILSIIAANSERWAERIKDNFGDNLKKIIVDSKGFGNAFFNFQISDISYGSLDIILEIANAKNLAEKFNGSIDLFIGFLEMYAPLALVKTVGMQNFASDAIYGKVDVSKDLSNEFNNTTYKSSNGSLENDKLSKFLILAKFSWVIPIALSLIIFFSLFKEMSETKSFYLNNYNSVLQQQQELLKYQNDFLKTEIEFQKKYYNQLFITDSLNKVKK